MNIAKLKKLKKWILAEPRRYRQLDWFFQKDSEAFREQNPPCGTLGCLAGNACAMEGYKERYNEFRDAWIVKRGRTGGKDVRQVATKILGLSDTQAHNLFEGTCDGWPLDAMRLYRDAKTPEDRAKAAAIAIDALIEKGHRSRKTKGRKE